MACPKCGSNNIKFHREREGATYSRRYRRTGVKSSWLFPAGLSSGSRNYDYRTVGVCQNCGYTFTTSSSGNSGCLIYVLLFAILVFLLSKYSGGSSGKSSEKSNQTSTAQQIETISAVTPVPDEYWVTPVLDDFEYSFSNGTVTLTEYKGIHKSLIIPSSFLVEGDQVPVRRVSFTSENMRASIPTNLIISDGIEWFHLDSSNYKDLKHIYLPASLHYFSSDVKKIRAGETLFYGGTEKQWNDEVFYSRSDIGFKKIQFNATPSDCMNAINTTANDSGKRPSGYEPLDSFSYDIIDGALVLGSYRGKNKTVIIAPEYGIDGQMIPVGTLKGTFGGSGLDTVIIPEGVTTIASAYDFSGSLTNLFIPRSLIDIPTDFFKHSHGQIETLYYAGSENEWNKICPVSRWDLNIKHMVYEASVEDINIG